MTGIYGKLININVISILNFYVMYVNIGQLHICNDEVEI